MGYALPISRYHSFIYNNNKSIPKIIFASFTSEFLWWNVGSSPHFEYRFLSLPFSNQRCDFCQSWEMINGRAQKCFPLCISCESRSALSFWCRSTFRLLLTPTAFRNTGSGSIYTLFCENTEISMHLHFYWSQCWNYEVGEYRIEIFFFWYVQDVQDTFTFWSQL